MHTCYVYSYKLWATGDIPLKEHLKHFPFWIFAKVRATEILNQDYTNMTKVFGIYKIAEKIVSQLGFPDKLLCDELEKLEGNTIKAVDLLDAIFETQLEKLFRRTENWMQH